MFCMMSFCELTSTNIICTLWTIRRTGLSWSSCEDVWC